MKQGTHPPIDIRLAFSIVQPTSEPLKRSRARSTIRLPLMNWGMPTPVSIMSRTFSRNLLLILSVYMHVSGGCGSFRYVAASRIR